MSTSLVPHTWRTLCAVLHLCSDVFCMYAHVCICTCRRYGEINEYSNQSREQVLINAF